MVFKFVYIYGIAIIVFTILIKIAMSFQLTYKSFLSQAKMKVLRPEITELGEKFKRPIENSRKQMKLYNPAGAILWQVVCFDSDSIYVCLFPVFPSAFELRQKGSLWADDLSSFDQVITVPHFYMETM